jgi:ketosteroid isomerase-like protein
MRREVYDMSETTTLQPEPGWGSATRHARIGRLSHGEVGRAIDRIEIAERVYRYGWAYDERDRELLGDCFTEDAVWEGSVMGQHPVGPYVGRERIVEWLAEVWGEQRDQRRHIFTNLVTEDLTDDTAAGDATLTTVTTGPYRFELSRGPDSWRIARLVGGFDTPF